VVLRLALLMLMLAFAAACGGEEPKSSAPAVEEEEEEGGAGLREVYSPDKGSATLTGTVTWEGKAPKRRAIDMAADPYCENCWQGEEPLRSETAVVGPNGELANVFVYLKGPGLRRWKFERGDATRVIDQVSCRYIPHVIGVQQGDELHVKNSDSTMHNIHANPKEGGDDWFNQGQPNKGDVYKTTAGTAGIFKLKCDVHGWMGAWICVSKTPFFAVTGVDGRFTIPDLPAGDYTVLAWHEKQDEGEEATITVKDGETKTVSFTFSR